MEYLLTIWKNPTLIPEKKKMLISKSSLITSTSHKVVQNFCYPKKYKNIPQNCSRTFRIRSSSEHCP